MMTVTIIYFQRYLIFQRQHARPVDLAPLVQYPGQYPGQNPGQNPGYYLHDHRGGTHDR